MIKAILKTQIQNVFQKLLAVKEGISTGEFENIAFAVDYIFSPAEIDMFTTYIEQFGIKSADDLINVLNQFGIDLSSEIEQVGKDIINEVIKYLNSEEKEEVEDDSK